MLNTPLNHGNAPCTEPKGVLTAPFPTSPTAETPSAGVGGKPAPPAGAQRRQGAGGATAAGGRYVHDSDCQHLDIENPESQEISEEIEAWFRKSLREDVRKRVRRRIAKCLFTLGRDDEAKRIASCGSWFRVKQSLCGTSAFQRIGCNHLLCPDCNLDRVKPLQARLGRIIKAEKGLSVFRFITLTVPSVERIDREYIDGLVHAFRKLRRQEVWGCCVLGGFYAIDTTWNSKHGWHVHFHALIQFKRNVPGVTSETGWHYPSWLRRLKKSWAGLTGAENIHVRGIDGKVVKELCKYTAKAASFNHVPALVGEYCDAFADVRRLQGWGTFRADRKNYPPEPDESQDFCECGGCRREDWVYIGVVHESETRLLPDGTRLLGLTMTGLPPPGGDVRLN